MRAEIISVGTELLLGQIVDSNAAHLSRLLPGLGIDLLFRNTVGDNFHRVSESLKLALSRSDLVFTIGGLGPTEDDLTKEAVAKTLGVELEIDEESAEWIRGFFAQRGLEMPERNLKQALRPKTGRVLTNDVGTAPGAVFESGDKAVICLPGPPGEFMRMVDTGVLPYLRERNHGATTLIKSKVLRIVGMGESAVEDRVRDLLSSRNPTIAPLAHLGEVHIRITAKAIDAPAADLMISGMEEKLRERIGEVIFGTDDETLEEVIVKRLIERGLKLAVAESCTGGLIAHRITNVPGCSETFMASVVSYSNDAKMTMLGVPDDLLRDHGAVSHEVARAMALGAQKAAGADVAISVTGIAGPGGGSKEKPVGLVYIALSAPNHLTSEKNRFLGSRLDIKNRSAQTALVMLRDYLEGVR